MAVRGREALIEFQRVGAYLKATAIDPETLVEVSSVGPSNAREQLRRTVLAKLEYVLSKRATGS
ncbi:DUF6898 family protein [Arenibaculum pallidiluteum]|uniref:DUF6898 family protein n=1 Tax=Arenibaculum pallidiluteum TaxID=2812559 RepID=UPI001A9662E2|nr:hypothetical protein [Arenibaculum pallidiluteum]